MFDDPFLNELEQQVDVSNQSLALAAANYRVARALVGEARAQLFPTVTTSPSVTQSKFGSGTNSTSGTTSTSLHARRRPRHAVQLPFDLPGGGSGVASGTRERGARTRPRRRRQISKPRVFDPIPRSPSTISSCEGRTRRKRSWTATLSLSEKALDLTRSATKEASRSDETSPSRDALNTTIARTRIRGPRAQLEHAIAA